MSFIKSLASACLPFGSRDG